MDKVEKARELFKRLESLGKDFSREKVIREFEIRERLAEIRN